METGFASFSTSLSLQGKKCRAPEACLPLSMQTERAGCLCLITAWKNCI